MRCHKAIVVITGRSYCFHDYIYISYLKKRRFNTTKVSCKLWLYTGVFSSTNLYILSNILSHHIRFISKSMEYIEPAKVRALRAHIPAYLFPYVPKSQHALLAHWLMFLTCSRTNMPCMATFSRVITSNNKNKFLMTSFP